MKKIVFITACCFLLTSAVYAQEKQKRDTAAHLTKNGAEKPETENNNTFRDDSTDAAMGMSGLSGTPGTATTTGAGGLGTNETRPYKNTSSDIYNMERQDSIENAQKKKDSVTSKSKTGKR